MKKQRKGFWAKFEDLMDSLPGVIDEEINNSTSIIQSGDSSVNIVGKGNKVSSFSSNTSTINQDGRKIVIKTVNKKLTITVNGKEVYREEK